MKRTQSKKDKGKLAIIGVLFVCVIGMVSCQQIASYQGKSTDPPKSEKQQKVTDSKKKSKKYIKETQDSSNKNVIQNEDKQETSPILDTLSPAPANLTNQRQQALDTVQQLVTNQQEEQKKESEKDKVPTPEPPNENKEEPKPEQPEPPEPPVEVKVDYSELITTIYQAESIDLSLYLSSSIEQFSHELLVSREMVKNGSSTQTEVNNQTTRLLLAIQSLVIKGDKTALAQLVNEANEIDKEFYYSPSIDEFSAALEAAKALLAENEVTQSLLNQMESRLKETIAALEKKTDLEIAKIELNRIVESVVTINLEEYTETSYLALEAKITAAKAMLESKDSTLEDIQQAIDDLIAAKEDLIKRADKTELESTYDLALTLMEENYTAESWTVLQMVLDDVTSILDDPNVAQEVVDSKVAAILEAIDGLIEILEEIEPEEPTGDIEEEPTEQESSELENQIFNLTHETAMNKFNNPVDPLLEMTFLEES